MATRGERLLAAVLGAQLLAGTAAAVHLQPAATRQPVPAVAVENARSVVVDRAAAVRALLQARATAVLAHDRAGFLATVDPQGGAFRTRQAAYVAALADVPLARWSYELDPAHEQRGDADLDRRRGTWWAPDVTLRYALAGFDRRPTTQQQGLTFVERQGRWYVGADDDFPGRPTGRDLWDGGRVTASRGTACLVLAHPRQARLVRRVLADCDAAVPRVTAVWGRDWAQRVVVLVPDTVVELGRLVPGAGDLSQIAAVATAELLDPGSGYHPVGDRVLVNPVTFNRLSPLGRRVVTTHEVTHVATRAATGPQVPTWLVEGIADYVGYLGTSVPDRLAAAELRRDVRAGRVPTRLPGERAFASDAPDLAQAYEMAWLACRVVVDRFGRPGLLRLYRAVGADPADGALGRALAALGTTEAELVALWRADLVARLR